MPLLLNQIDAHASSEDKSNGTGNALLLQECFLFPLLRFYYTVFTLICQQYIPENV